MPDSNGVNNQPKKYDWASKRSAYLVAGIVVLVLAALGIYAYTHTGGQNSAQQGGNSNNVVSPAATATPPSASIVPGKLSYGDAIKTYTERFQFSQCQGTPATIAVKKGSPVMLDNRDAIAHTFKADTQTFKIAGYDYAVLYPQVLGNLVVTCDGKDRVTLNVEK